MELMILPYGKVLSIPEGANVRLTIAAAGIHLRSDCGGVGRCGKCKVLGRHHLSPLSPSEKERLTPKELRKGVRLACQTRVKESAEVFIPVASLEKHLRILVEGVPKTLKPKPAVRRETLPISFLGSERDFSWEALRRQIPAAKKFKPCPTLQVLQRLAENGALKKYPLSLILIDEQVVELENGDRGPICGLALDLGTTTIVGYLLDLLSGKQLASAARVNPQTRYGADVVSRILYATSSADGLKKLQHAVIRALKDIIQEACQKAGVLSHRIFEICAVGNTTMHHLLLGLQPHNLTRFPYTPVIRQAFALPAKEIGVSIHPEGQLFLLPLISGFMGSDTVGVVLSTRLHRSKSIKLAIDIGTNGEVVLGNRDRLVATSCAAGPAFEGSQIQHGMTGSSGAIDALSIDGEGQVNLHTIDDLPPVGICGSGLVDAVAEIRRRGVIDQAGRLLRPGESGLPSLAPRIIQVDGQWAFLLWQEGNRNKLKRIYLTQKDVRELQLAKSAMWAGIQILLKTLGIKYQDISEVFLAGAFGNYVKPESAMGIGLLPAFAATRVKPVGNAAGMGAKLALLSLKARLEASLIAQKIEYVDLAKHPDFQPEFIAGMAFPPLKDAGG